MAYRGISSPAIIYFRNDDPEDRQVLYLPTPDKGGRSEEYEDISDRYENINGELITTKPKWRFKAKYNFSSVVSTQIDILVSFNNKSNAVTLIPHKDFAMINYKVAINSVIISGRNGFINKDSLNIECESIEPIYKIPSLDNMLGCALPYRIGWQTNQ
tara:strand:+ start:2849 stop:3322 length:474 start_codon:yes stop_codon:yes gene_type:complete